MNRIKIVERAANMIVLKGDIAKNATNSTEEIIAFAQRVSADKIREARKKERSAYEAKTFGGINFLSRIHSISVRLNYNTLEKLTCLTFKVSDIGPDNRPRSGIKTTPKEEEIIDQIITIVSQKISSGEDLKLVNNKIPD